MEPIEAVWLEVPVVPVIDRVIPELVLGPAVVAAPLLVLERVLPVPMTFRSVALKLQAHKARIGSARPTIR